MGISSDSLRPGDLILVRGDGPIQHAIERVSRSPYSHVAGVVATNELIESQALRTTGYAALDSYKDVSDVYTCPALTDDQRAQIVQWALNEVGTKYDYTLIAWEAFHFLLNVNCAYHEDGRHFDCSELWRQAYKSIGVDLRPDLQYAAPGDLALSPLLTKVGTL